MAISESLKAAIYDHHKMTSTVSPPLLRWVLCSQHIDDIVMICPEDIDNLPIEEQYPFPTAQQILRSLFHHTRTKNCGKCHHK